MDDYRELLSGLTLELRRGSTVLCVLASAAKPIYGYWLVQELDALGVPIEANTLYPLLRRLEKQGLLKSEWETAGAKPRKYYLRTEAGDEMFQALKKQWLALSEKLEQLLTENEER